MAPIRSRATEEGGFEIPWWGIPLVLILMYVCLFSGLGALGLVGPDEPRYAAIARAMAETHDWVTPRLWGTPWFEKPALYYWAAGIAMRMFGVSEFAARLPSALAGLLATIAVAWTALRSYGVGTAWYSLLMLPTSVGMIGFSRAAGPDMLFAGLLTAAMAVALEMLQKERASAFLQIAFGFFLGAAVLAKGPAAVILAGGATMLWAAFTRQWLAPFCFLHPLVIAAFCVTALPWYILCALRNPDFLQVFIWQHNFQRYLTPAFEHRQPFWFFGPIFLLGILPWLPVVVLTCVDGIRERHSAIQQRSPSILIACWCVFTLLFFSASQSKLPGYILPAIPPAVLLAARGFELQVERKHPLARVAAISTAAIFPILIAIEFAKPGLVFGSGVGFEPNPMRGLQICLVTALLGGGLAGALLLYRRWNLGICSLACTVGAIILIANHMVLPAVDAFLSARPAIRYMSGMQVNSNEVAVYGLPRGYEYGLDYYFGTALPRWYPNTPPPPFLFYGTGDFDERTSPKESTYLNDRSKGSFDFVPVTLDGKVFLRTGPRSSR